MPCYITKLKDGGGRMFLCGDLGPHCEAADCGDVSEFLCDYPVGDGKTCDKPLCESHADEIGPDLHYCPAHSAMWKAYRDSGGLARDLENVQPFKRPTA